MRKPAGKVARVSLPQSFSLLAHTTPISPLPTLVPMYSTPSFSGPPILTQIYSAVSFLVSLCSHACTLRPLSLAFRHLHIQTHPVPSFLASLGSRCTAGPHPQICGQSMSGLCYPCTPYLRLPPINNLHILGYDCH